MLRSISCWNGRGSSSKSRSPFLTIWPSVKWTFWMWPRTRARTSTVAEESSQPLKSSLSTSSRTSACCTVTLGGGASARGGGLQQPASARAPARARATVEDDELGDGPCALTHDDVSSAPGSELDAVLLHHRRADLRAGGKDLVEDVERPFGGLAALVLRGLAALLLRVAERGAGLGRVGRSPCRSPNKPPGRPATRPARRRPAPAAARSRAPPPRGRTRWRPSRPNRPARGRRRAAATARWPAPAPPARPRPAAGRA